MALTQYNPDTGPFKDWSNQHPTGIPSNRAGTHDDTLSSQLAWGVGEAWVHGIHQGQSLKFIYEYPVKKGLVQKVVRFSYACQMHELTVLQQRADVSWYKMSLLRNYDDFYASRVAVRTGDIPENGIRSNAGVPQGVPTTSLKVAAQSTLMTKAIAAASIAPPAPKATAQEVAQLLEVARLRIEVAQSKLPKERDPLRGAMVPGKPKPGSALAIAITHLEEAEQALEDGKLDTAFDAVGKSINQARDSGTGAAAAREKKLKPKSVVDADYQFLDDVLKTKDPAKIKTFFTTDAELKAWQGLTPDQKRTVIARINDPTLGYKVALTGVGAGAVLVAGAAAVATTLPISGPAAAIVGSLGVSAFATPPTIGAGAVFVSSLAAGTGLMVGSLPLKQAEIVQARFPGLAKASEGFDYGISGRGNDRFLQIGFQRQESNWFGSGPE